MHYVQLFRIKQWIKNAIVFLPLFFGGALLNTHLLLQVILCFIAFSFTASAVYVLNDIRDAKFDALHPKKKIRPIASGKIPAGNAYAAGFILLTAGLALSWYLHHSFTLILVAYIVINVAYSLYLKHIPIIDVSCIALGFILRIYAGGIIGGIEISQWLVIMAFFMSLFIALGKRRDDVLLLQTDGQKMRKSVDGYNLIFINSAMAILAAVLIVGYIMYSVSAEITSRFNDNTIYMSTGFVVVGLLRYLQICLVEEKSGSPTDIIYNDRLIQLMVLLWGLFFVQKIYL